MNFNNKEITKIVTKLTMICAKNVRKLDDDTVLPAKQIKNQCFDIFCYNYWCGFILNESW